MNDEDNPMYGKAWVSMERLSIELGVNRKTISKHLHILEAVELINIKRFYRGGRKHCSFTFNQHLSEEGFKEKFPEVVAEYLERLKASEKTTDIEPWYNPENIETDE
jgi:predicted ArsR family transcriptional regulator